MQGRPFKPFLVYLPFLSVFSQATKLKLLPNVTVLSFHLSPLIFHRIHIFAFRLYSFFAVRSSSHRVSWSDFQHKGGNYSFTFHGIRRVHQNFSAVRGATPYECQSYRFQVRLRCFNNPMSISMMYPHWFVTFWPRIFCMWEFMIRMENEFCHLMREKRWT